MIGNSPRPGLWRLAWISLVAMLVALSGGMAGADVIVLENGGRLEGTLLDAKKTPRGKYIVETAGGRVTLEKSQVKEIIGQTASQEEYEKVRRQYPDTPDGQMALALWCRDHRLPRQRESLLRHVLELDPNHAEAHRLLKHFWVGGQWKSRQQYFEDQGYIQYLGKWMTPQEMELKEAARKTELAEKEWKRKLKTWRGWLEGPKAQEAIDQFDRISDPFATRALADALASDKDEGYRKRCVEALARIDTPAAWMILCNRMLIDPDDEVRLTCLDYVTERPVPAFTDYFVSRLRDKENVVINRAAMALGRLKDRRAIGPLIEVLRTVHIHQVAPADPGITSGIGSMNGGPSSGGFSYGSSGPKLIRKEYTNPEVLSALVTLTGGQNYDFDEAAWKTWHARQKRSLSLNARRDGQ
jgi:hypothetical protein